jgi:hypothetical protein
MKRVRILLVLLCSFGLTLPLLSLPAPSDGECLAGWCGSNSQCPDGTASRNPAKPAAIAPETVFRGRLPGQTGLRPVACARPATWRLRSVTGAAVRVCAVSSITRAYGFPIEIERLPGTMAIPAAFELVNLSLGPDSKSSRRQDRSSNGDARRRRWAALPTLAAQDRGQSDSSLGAERDSQLLY